MKKPLAILLALLLLIFNSGLALNQHLCLGKAIGFSFSIGQEKLSCGMEAMPAACDNSPELAKQRCCKDLSYHFEIKDNVTKAVASKLLVSPLALFSPLFTHSAQPEAGCTSSAFAYHSPPDVSHVSLPDLGVFRI